MEEGVGAGSGGGGRTAGTAGEAGWARDDGPTGRGESGGQLTGQTKIGAQPPEKPLEEGKTVPGDPTQKPRRPGTRILSIQNLWPLSCFFSTL